ncbi:MAG: PLP-dependent aminotransferase family protein [Oscillospiraceae bacterium]|nr:PLP-dependent aminotransferase family protein [Oscillospiraceae bacterium]
MQKFAHRMTAMAETAEVVKNLFGALGDPELISLGIGAPAREALPVDIVREISQDVLRRETRGVEALQYGPVMGVQDLREVVANQLLTPKGVKTDAEHVMITTGGLETISLTCALFINPDDVILVESPTFVHAVETFQLFEAKCVGVRMDDDGMDVEDLEEKIRRYHPKMIYTIPTFQNPTGRTLSLPRRKRVAELAAQYDVLVLEDDPYRDIRYSGEDLLPIKAFDTSENVILGNSFSKIFSAGSRLGYIVGNDKVMAHLKDAKSAINSHTSMLPQILCAEFFKRGYYVAHHKMICDLYRERRDVMMECLDRFFPEGTKHTRPDGGLFTWAELPGGLNTTELLREAVSRKDVKVSYIAGEKFFTDGAPITNCMRISFGAVPPDQIRLATQRLGSMLREKLE